jgi:hypothetical protein
MSGSTPAPGQNCLPGALCFVENCQDVTIIGQTEEFLDVETHRYREIHVTKTARTTGFW